MGAQGLAMVPTAALGSPSVRLAFGLEISLQIPCCSMNGSIPTNVLRRLLLTNRVPFPAALSCHQALLWLGVATVPMP